MWQAPAVLTKCFSVLFLYVLDVLSIATTVSWIDCSQFLTVRFTLVVFYFVVQTTFTQKQGRTLKTKKEKCKDEGASAYSAYRESRLSMGHVLRTLASSFTSWTLRLSESPPRGKPPTSLEPLAIFAPRSAKGTRRLDSINFSKLTRCRVVIFPCTQNQNPKHLRFPHRRAPFALGRLQLTCLFKHQCWSYVYFLPVWSRFR